MQVTYYRAGRGAACSALAAIMVAITVSAVAATAAHHTMMSAVLFAVPPAHAASNDNLFVSAEDSLFENHMAGPQVIEVVVADPDIGHTHTAQGEPDVTINGRTLRMAQATDGNWYGYFADYRQAVIADRTVRDAGVSGAGPDFGAVCPAADGPDGVHADLGIKVGEAAAVALPARCDDVSGQMNVVRQAKELCIRRRADRR